jgi:hypothetical protein
MVSTTPAWGIEPTTSSLGAMSPYHQAKAVVPQSTTTTYYNQWGLGHVLMTPPPPQLFLVKWEVCSKTTFPRVFEPTHTYLTPPDRVPWEEGEAMPSPKGGKVPLRLLGFIYQQYCCAWAVALLWRVWMGDLWSAPVNSFACKPCLLILQFGCPNKIMYWAGFQRTQGTWVELQRRGHSAQGTWDPRW